MDEGTYNPHASLSNTRRAYEVSIVSCRYTMLNYIFQDSMIAITCDQIVEDLLIRFLGGIARMAQ